MAAPDYAHIDYLLQQEHYHMAMESEEPDHYLRALHRALLATEADEEYLRALMSSRGGGGSFRYEAAMDEFDEALRNVGKSQSMRAVSSFNEENELWRHAFNSMRRYNTNADIRPMHNSGTDGYHGYHSTPVFDGFYNHGGIGTPQAWSVPFYNGSSQFGAPHSSFSYGYYGEEEQQNRRIQRPVEESKIDETRSQSMREMGQCWACGQRLWGADTNATAQVLPSMCAKRQHYHHQHILHQQEEKPEECGPCNAKHHQPQHKRTSSSVPPHHPSSSSAFSSHSSSAVPSAPISAPPPSTIDMGCKPSAQRKKKTRFIQRCRQLLGLAIKT